MGLVGLTQVDLGLDKRWVWSFGALESVVVERFLSCSDRDGFLLSVDSDEIGEALRGDLEEEEQRTVNRLVKLFRGRGEVKKMGVGLRLRSREEERGAAMGESLTLEKEISEEEMGHRRQCLIPFPNTKISMETTEHFVMP